MADTVKKLAYDEAKAAITSQASVLDGLRSRAGTMFAAASLVTAFLGGQALAKPSLSNGVVVRPDIGAEGWIAIALFVGVAVMALVILWPYEWKFAMSANVILAGETAGGTFEGIQGQLAGYHEGNYESNQEKLDRLFWAFRLACVFLVGETVAWIVDLSS